ncbi:hypothetical protein Z950_1422 [Sulfitobacter mediterraneus KCTC 32188]|nr:hypothetical protein Z950_1422 [Sulfitobacter mediterraneus KCTC 32188]
MIWGGTVTAVGCSRGEFGLEPALWRCLAQNVPDCCKGQDSCSNAAFLSPRSVNRR